MKRRNFLSIAGLTGTGLIFEAFSPAAKQKKLKEFRGTFSALNNNISIFTKANVKSIHIFHITDTHLSIDDERGEEYLEFSRRMSDAYKINTHFQSGESYSTKDSFEWTLKRAKEENADLLALTGDIFSFPSEAAIEWVLNKLDETDIPFVYVAGNHDWHYEGMKGSSMKLRSLWIEKRLKAMYQGRNPLFASFDLNGIRFICIDNSTYEILPQQLQFFKDMVNSSLPIILMMHIPLYMPGRPMAYGCAHPEWGENTDRNFEIERREKWRQGGHTKVTFDFYNEVFRASNLLTILAGHTHQSALDVKNGIPQIVSSHNATGYFSDIRISTL